jgi:hypothetical protein
MRDHATRRADLIHRGLEDAVGRVIGVRDDDLALGLGGGGGKCEEGEDGNEGELHCCCCVVSCDFRVVRYFIFLMKIKVVEGNMYVGSKIFVVGG